MEISLNCDNLIQMMEENCAQKKNKSLEIHTKVKNI